MQASFYAKCPTEVAFVREEVQIPLAPAKVSLRADKEEEEITRRF